MADSVVELANKIGLTLTDLNAGVSIATAAANQQVVVKDVVVSGANCTLDLRVGNHVVAKASMPNKLTGTEILSPGNSLVLKSNTRPLLTELYLGTYSGVTKYSGKTLYSDSIEMPPETSSLYTSMGLPYTPYFSCIGANGDFYYSNLAKSSTGAGYPTLYRKAGGFTGTQSTLIANGVTSACYDGKRYIWVYNTTGQYYLVDTLNGSFSTISYKDTSGTALLLSSYDPNSDSSSIIDGYLVLKPNYSGSFYFVVELATGVTRSLTLNTGMVTGTSLRYYSAVGKNLAGDYVLIWTDSLSYGSAAYGIFYANLGKSITGLALQQWGRIDAIPAFFNNTAVNRLQTVAATPSLIIQFEETPSNVFYVYDLESLSMTPISINFANTASVFFTACDIPKAVKDFGTVNVRATGILSQ